MTSDGFWESRMEIERNVYPQYEPMDMSEFFQSDWSLHIGGDIIYQPNEKAPIPNRFHRFMVKLLLGWEWRKK